MTNEEAQRKSLATRNTTEVSYGNNYDNELAMPYINAFLYQHLNQKREEDPRNGIRPGSRVKRRG